MAKPDTSSAVHPAVQASRMEQAAYGAFILRGRRDNDLAALGVAPECLALIGGGHCYDLTTSSAVAVWLSQSAQMFGLFAPFAMLLHQQMYGAKRKEGAHIFRARTVAATAIARQLTAAMLSVAADRQEREKKAHLSAKQGRQSAPPPQSVDVLPPPPDQAIYVGSFIASLVEAGDLSDTVAAMYALRAQFSPERPETGELPYVIKEMVLGMERTAEAERIANNSQTEAT